MSDNIDQQVQTELDKTIQQLKQHQTTITQIIQLAHQLYKHDHSKTGGLLHVYLEDGDINAYWPEGDKSQYTQQEQHLAEEIGELSRELPDIARAFIVHQCYDIYDPPLYAKIRTD